MIPSQTMPLKLLAAAGLLVVADPATELHVLRVAPSEDAAPTAAVTITLFPTDTCAWHDGEGGVALPAEYAASAKESDAPRSTRSVVASGFHIASPCEGDVYRLSPGVEARYATVALRAAGGRAGASVRWIVDDMPHAAGRWNLRPGRHRIRAFRRLATPPR